MVDIIKVLVNSVLDVLSLLYMYKMDPDLLPFLLCTTDLESRPAYYLDS